MKNLYIVLALILISLKVESQVLGFVYEQSSNKEKTPIVGASVYWEGTNISTTTFDDGSFLIDESNIPESRLMVSLLVIRLMNKILLKVCILFTLIKIPNYHKSMLMLIKLLYCIHLKTFKYTGFIKF